MYKCAMPTCLCPLFTACCDGDVHFGNSSMNGPANFNGRVDVCVNETWGTVCDDNFGRIQAGVVCGQMGFYRSSKTRYMCMYIHVHVHVDMGSGAGSHSSASVLQIKIAMLNILMWVACHH